MAPKVSDKEREAQHTHRLYTQIGQIAVLGEHLNSEMHDCCRTILEAHGLNPEFSPTVLVGQNLENMRRTWEMLMKQHYEADGDVIKMIDHISKRINNVIQRRNNAVHQLWFVGWGKDTKPDEGAIGLKMTRSIGTHGKGGVISTRSDTRTFQETIGEIDALSFLIERFTHCIGLDISITNKGKPRDNFHYENEKLMPGGPNESPAT
jgi:hypothetical protein